MCPCLAPAPKRQVELVIALFHGQRGPRGRQSRDSSQGGVRRTFCQRRVWCLLQPGFPVTELYAPETVRSTWFATSVQVKPRSRAPGPAVEAEMIQRRTHRGWRLGAFVGDLFRSRNLVGGLSVWAKSGLTARRAPAQQHPGRIGVDHAVFGDTTFGSAVAADVLPLELTRRVCIGID